MIKLKPQAQDCSPYWRRLIKQRNTYLRHIYLNTRFYASRFLVCVVSVGSVYLVWSKVFLRLATFKEQELGLFSHWPSYSILYSILFLLLGINLVLVFVFVLVHIDHMFSLLPNLQWLCVITYRACSWDTSICRELLSIIFLCMHV